MVAFVPVLRLPVRHRRNGPTAGDTVRIVAEQAGDGLLVVANISGETGEAMAQHVRRDVRRTRRALANSQIADPRLALEIAAINRSYGLR
jgi:hypothetical protein